MKNFSSSEALVEIGASVALVAAARVVLEFGWEDAIVVGARRPARPALWLAPFLIATRNAAHVIVVVDNLIYCTEVLLVVVVVVVCEDSCWFVLL